MSNNLFMEAGGIAGLTAGNFNVRGSAGIETVQVSGTAFLTIDQNVEIVEFTGAASDYLFSLSGNVVTVRTLDGTAVADISVSDVATSLRFADGGAELGIDFAARAITLGGDPIQSVPGPVTPALDASEASSIADVDPLRGSVFDLTTGADSFDPDSVSDEEASGPGNVYNAPLAPALDGTEVVETLQLFDEIEGSVHEDVLNAQLDGINAPNVPTITDVEVYNLTSLANLFGGGVNLDLSNASGYEELWNIGSRADLTIDNVGEIAAIGLDGVRGNTTYTVNYANADAADIQTVIAQNVGTPGLATSATTLDITSEIGDGFGTLNMIVDGPVDMVLAGDAATMETFNLRGSGPLTLDGTDDFDELETFNSTLYTDGLTLDISGGTVLRDIDTGVGNDEITIAAGTVVAGFSADLGDGDDTLVVQGETDASINGLNFVGGVSNVETIAFEGPVTLGADATLNLNGVDDALDTVEFEGALTGGANTLTLANRTGALDVGLGSDMNIAGLNAGTLSDLDIIAPDAGSITLGNIGGGALEALGLSAGSIDATVTSDATNDVSALQSLSADASTAADVTLDASDADADMSSLVSVDVTSNGTADLTMFGVVSGIVAAQTAFDAAQNDLTAAQNGVTAAQNDLALAEGVRDQALIDQGLAQSDRDDAQADLVAAQAIVDAEQIDVNTAQGVVDAATLAVTAAQSALDTADGALNTAQATLTSFGTYLDAFNFVVSLPPTPTREIYQVSNDNIGALETYIVAADLTAAQETAILALIPDRQVPADAGPVAFNELAEFNSFATAANTALSNLLDIAGLTTARDAAQTDLAAKTTDLGDANTVLATEQVALSNAEAARDAAQDALNIAQNALNVATTVAGDAQSIVDLAEADLRQAEADLRDAEDVFLAAQDALAAASPEGSGFEGLETVVVTADGDVFVDLEDIYGAFSLDVSFGGATGLQDGDAVLVDTGVTAITMSGGVGVEYDFDVNGNVIGVRDIEYGTVSLDAGTVGNNDLTSITISGAAGDVFLEGSLDSLRTIDVTDVTVAYWIDAEFAEYDLAAGEFVTYLVGGAASDFGGANFGFGDSLITMNADGRETIVFTDDTFGSVVLEGFQDGADPLPADRIDLSQLGFTGDGQLVFETGTYDGGAGEWAAGAGNDVRITDLAGGVADFEGEIIVTGITSVEDLQSNILYA